LLVPLILIRVVTAFAEIGVQLGPLCSAKFSVGRASEQSIALGEALATLITSTGVFDLNELCINAGTSVWVIYADLVCLDFDGNVLDACVLALNSALKHCMHRFALSFPSSSLSLFSFSSFCGVTALQCASPAHTPMRRVWW
jgi:hypothetical protein